MRQPRSRHRSSACGGALSREPALAMPRRWWRIAQDDDDRKARALEERRRAIALRIDQHQKGEDTFRTTLESRFSAFACRRSGRAFENRAEARLDCLRLF
jgi:hypothetical protein